VTNWRLDTTREGMFKTGTRVFSGQNPVRSAVFDFTLAKKAENLELKVVDISGKTIRTLNVAKETDAGFHRVGWEQPGEGGKKGFGGKGGGTFAGGGKGGGAFKGKGTKGQPQDPTQAAQVPKGGFGFGIGQALKPGVYRVLLVADGQEYSQTLVIEPDPTQRGAEIIADEAEEELQWRKLLRPTPPVLDP
jgi:hypothetical protein